MLKLVVNSAEEIPEGFADAYEERDGKFHLKLEDDVVEKKKLQEFRQNNIELLKTKEELEGLLKQFEGIDPKEVKEALEKKREMEEKKLLEAGEVDKLVEKRVERMRADFEGQSKALQDRIQELEQKKQELHSQLSNVLIDSQIQQAVNEVGKPRPGAMQDILNRGRALFKLIDGKPTPIGSDGNPIFGKDGKAPMTFKEWAASLQESAGFLFESSSGGGSQGNRSGGSQSPTKTIPSGDPVVFGQNLESIAQGKVAVQ